MPLSGPYDFHGIPLTSAYVTFCRYSVDSSENPMTFATANVYASEQAFTEGLSPVDLVQVSYNYDTRRSLFRQCEDEALLLPAFSQMQKV